MVQDFCDHCQRWHEAGAADCLAASSEAERSGVLQGCPPSATGCPGAGADGQAVADSSGRCPEVNGPALAAKWRRIAKAYMQIVNEHRAKGSQEADEMLLGAQIYRQCADELEMLPDAGQCNGQRVLPDAESSDR